MKHWTDEYINMNRQTPRIDVIGQNGNDGLHYPTDRMGTFPGEIRTAFKPGGVKVLQQWVEGERCWDWRDVPEVVLDD